MNKPITLKITAKGQVTLRQDVLRELGVRPGDNIVLEKVADHHFSMRPPPKGKISDVFGMLKRPGQPRLTIEEIKRATEDAWAGKR
jgi:bifunctional DNA-binding transcriptional regulator/antitoxin component of YhaV-PrlF toxin-antitoxin module